MKREEIPYWRDQLHKGNFRSLTKLITWTESSLSTHRRWMNEFFQTIGPINHRAKVIGITGAPGVGKSYFLNQFLLHPFFDLKRIALLTIDPSSHQSGGSLLGDQTRMNDLVQRENIFIRPSPSKGALGGISPQTWDVIQLCHYAQFDYIFIESVGVGQSEIDLAYLVDQLFLLIQPGLGDEIQSIKKGIMEAVDGFIITKADLYPTRAHHMSRMIQNPIALTDSSSGSENRPVFIFNTEADAPFETLISYFEQIKSRKLAHDYWISKLWQQSLWTFLQNQTTFQSFKTHIIHQLNNNEITHQQAVQLFLDKFKNQWSDF